MSEPAFATNTAAAFRALPDDPTPIAVQRRRHRRVVFAATWFITTALAFATNEALHWRSGVDVGFSFRGVSTEVDYVFPNSIAGRAGVHVGHTLLAVDDEAVFVVGPSHGDRYVPEGRRLLVDTDGRVTLRAGDTPVRFRFANEVHVAREIDLVASGVPRLVRVPGTFFILPWLLPLSVLLSVLAAAIAGARYQPSSSLASSLRQRERSVRWLALVTAVVVPLIGHAFMLTLLTAMSGKASVYLGIAIFATALPHLLLVRAAVHNANKILEGDLEPQPRAAFIAACIVPGALFVVPTLLTLGIGLPVLRALRHDAQRVCFDSGD